MSWINHVKQLIEKEWDQKYIMMGLDCDSMLCACILRICFPTSQIVGLYDTEYVVQLQNVTKPEFKQQIKRALWVDQDVLCNFLCIGQHLTTGDCIQNISSRNENSFNPNEFFKQQYIDSFRTDSTTDSLTEQTDCRKSSVKSKCPFSTAMLLLHVFDDQWKRNKELDTILMHADSIGYNLLVYSKNCEAWRRLLFETEKSQINDLLCEMQKVYDRNWRPLCTQDHDCKKMNDCYCQECSNLCSIRAEQRNKIQRHFQLMCSLRDLMPDYFDADSRKTLQKKTTVAIPAVKHPRECLRESICDLKDMLGGFQGLKLRYKDERKFGPKFAKKQFLIELNAFYKFVFQLFAHEKNYLVDEFFEIKEYLINKSSTEGFGIHNGKTSVFLKGENQWMPLNEFVIKKDLFSYAILNKNTIRYTFLGGILEEP